jgi:UDP-glucose 4-epimerase
MKVLVVGSKGFIGSNVSDVLSKQHEVWGCDTYSNYTEKNFYVANATSFDFAQMFRDHKFDFCINCSGAASVPDSLANPQHDFELNVFNVVKLLDGIRQHNNECKFINISSAAIYGSPGALPINELFPVNPMSPYGYHKAIAEQIAHEYHKFFRLPTCSIRIFSAYGPGLRKQLLWDLFLKSKGANSIELHGTGNETRDFVFIDDIVQAILIVMERSAFEAEVYNVASGKSWTVKNVCKLLLDNLGWTGTVKFSGSSRPGDPDVWTADISEIGKLGFLAQMQLPEGIKKYSSWLQSLD